VGPRTGLDDVERRKILALPGLELRALGFDFTFHKGIVFKESKIIKKSNCL
jgi:hypothetical protein